jgi:small subunit ribosomal protein S1
MESDFPDRGRGVSQGHDPLTDWLRQETFGRTVLRRGDAVTGRIVRIDRQGILVDIGSKSEGLVPPQEAQDLLQHGVKLSVGQEVLCFVVRPEDAEGQVILSLRRGLTEQAWQQLEKAAEAGEVLEGQVVEVVRGGVVVSVAGVRGFVPASQLVSGRTEAELSELVGKALPLKVLDINRRRNRLILSERLGQQARRLQQQAELVRSVRPGEIRTGRVSGISDFGAFVDLGGVEGLVHISELSWDRVEHPSKVVKIGEEVQVYVLAVDPQAKRIALSLKRVQPEPWATVAERYKVGQLVRASITRLASFGAFARVEAGVEGLVHLSELSDRPIKHPREVVKEGDVVTLKVISVDPERKRLGLSLRQAREELASEG